MSDKRRVFWGYWDFPLSPRYFASFPIDQHGIFLVAIATSSTQSTGWKKKSGKKKKRKIKKGSLGPVLVFCVCSCEPQKYLHSYL